MDYCNTQAKYATFGGWTRYPLGKLAAVNFYPLSRFSQWLQNSGSADLVEFAFQSCYRKFAPIQQVFDNIGILDLTLRCFMAFIFRSKNRIFSRLIIHSKIRNVAILTAKVTTSQLLRQKIMILYYCPFKKHFYLTNNGFHHSVH